jgi:uncharacterized Zn finger protein
LRTILYSSFDVNDQVLTGMTFAEPSMITEARLRILNRHHCYDAYMNLARVTGYHSMYLNMLVEQHRYAEAASEAAHLLKDQASILDVVLALSQANANRYAMYLATRGLRYRSADPRLALWICETALNAQDRPLALRAALKAFEQAPSYETYCQLYNLLGDDWPDLKPSLDVLIEEKEVLITDRISIYLDTEDLEAVLRLVESHDIPTETLRTVVKASILKHPNWSIQKARERADIIMDTHQVSEWPFAFELLTLIKTAHQRTGRTREWEWYLENLMIRHEDKSGLVNQLQNFC